MSESANPALPVPESGVRYDMLWLYAVFALLATAGFFYINIMAAIVDGLITGLGFSNAEAGMVGSANIYGASFGALSAVFIVRHVRWRPVLAVLFVLMMCIDLLSTVIQVPTLLILARAAHGIIAGMSVGIVYSVMARLASPDRAFGVLLVLQFGLGGLGVMFLPQLVPQFGARILFLVLAALTALAMLAILAVPRTLDANQGNAQRVAGNAGLRHPVALAALFSLFLFQAGNMALAAFIIRLGEHFHLERGFISDALGWATWIGTLGAVLVIVMGTRFGRLRPLIVAFLLTLVGTAAFLWSGSWLVFLVANVGTAITWSYVVPYLFGMISRLDGSGRLATMGGFVSKCGLASGPLAAGFLLRTDNFALLIWLAFATLVLSGLAALLTARRIDQMELST